MRARAQLADAIEEWPPPPRRSALGLLLLDTATDAYAQLHPDHARVDTWPEPTDAVGVVEVARGEGGQRAKGRVPLERQNPHSQNTRTLRPWANLSAETKPARFASGLWVDPPEGWVDWVWLMGYEEGGARKR